MNGRNHLLYESVLGIFVTFFIFIMSSGFSVVHAESLKARVIDNKGESYDVTDIVAFYVVGGWIGVPAKSLSRLEFELTTTENRVTYTDNFKIPFSDIRSISYEYEPGKKDMVIIEKKNGSIIEYEVRKKSFIEKDIKGETLKELSGVSILAGRYNSRTYSIYAYKGMSKTKSGKKGKFSILKSEVKKIEFK